MTTLNKGFGSVLLLCTALLILAVPGHGMAAQVAASASAQLTWDSITFSSAVNWLDPTGADTRGSFSSAAVGLNGPADPYAPVDYIDGAPWGNTSATRTLNAPNGTVTGSASTTVPVQGNTTHAAAANISLTNVGTATVDVAQAVLSGQFTVAAQTTLTITAQYLLAASLLNDFSSFLSSAYADVSAGLTLSDFDTALLLQADERFYPFILNGLGTVGPFSESGTLSISWDLIPGVTYDFEAQASVAANAEANVPEPASLILIGSGLLGLAGFRKKFSRTD